MASGRGSNKELCFELKDKGLTVEQIAKNCDVSTRTIFNWLKDYQSIKPITDPPEDFDSSVELLGKALSIEIAKTFDFANDGGGVSERIWRLSKSLGILQILAQSGGKTPKRSKEVQDLREKLSRRLKILGLGEEEE